MMGISERNLEDCCCIQKVLKEELTGNGGI